MAISQLEKTSYWNRADEHSLENFGLQKGDYLMAMLFGQLAHEDDGLATMGFDEIISFGLALNERRGKQTPVNERWLSADRIPEEFKQNIRILSFEKPHLRIALIELSKLVAELFDLEAQQKNGTLSVGGRDIQEELDDRYMMYGEIVDLVMRQVNQEYRTEIVDKQTSDSPHLVTVTLRRGGERFQNAFSVDGATIDNGSIVSVEAKRLDMAAPEAEEHGELMVGLGGWRGLEEVKKVKQAQENGIHLTFADDCVSSSVSIRAFIKAWQERHKRGEVPELKKVSVLDTVGVQQGLIDLVNDVKAMKIEIQVISGDIAYRYSDKFYLERAEGEVQENKEEIPVFFKGGEVFVGDMGHFLTKAAEARERRKQVA